MHITSLRLDILYLYAAVWSIWRPQMGSCSVANNECDCTMSPWGDWFDCSLPKIDECCSTWQDVARQVKVAGEASEAVLMSAAAALSGRIQVERLAEEQLGTVPETMMWWNFNRSESSLAKALFPLTRYDPFTVARPQEKTMAFRTEAGMYAYLCCRFLLWCLHISTLYPH